jgi:hypothetical protein
MFSKLKSKLNDLCIIMWLTEAFDFCFAGVAIFFKWELSQQKKQQLLEINKLFDIDITNCQSFLGKKGKTVFTISQRIFITQYLLKKQQSTLCDKNSLRYCEKNYFAPTVVIT